MAINLFKWTLRAQGFPIAAAQRKLEELMLLPLSRKRDYIKTQRAAIVKFHLENNPYYQKLAINADPKDWNSLPILTKADLQKPLAERLSKGYTETSVYVNKTSGSSGHPFIFAKDKYAHAMTWAYIIQRYKEHGLTYGKELEARFYGIPLEKKGYWKESIKDRLAGRRRFPIFDLSDEKLDDFITRFQKTPFTYINGYASSILLLAKRLAKRDEQLKVLCPTLKCCITTSEMLFPEDRAIIEQHLGIPVINEYGASEADLIAMENPAGDWLINDYNLYIETIDDRILVTSLWNKAHPIIRYEIGDRGVLGEKNGQPILEKLIGRTNDIAHLPGGKRIPGLTFYYVTKSVIQNNGNIKEFVVRQYRTSNFEVVYVAEQALTDIEQNTILKALHEYADPSLEIQFTQVEILKRTARGKLKQFESLV